MAGSVRLDLLHYWILLLLWRTAHAAVDNNDLNALLALQMSLSNFGSTGFQWAGGDPCASKWPGISCDNSSPQRVISITLNGLGLSGTLPSDLSLLTALQTLDMSANTLGGSLPPLLGKLISLKLLSLQSNQFTGSIPAELGQLQNLTQLSLNNNKLQGPIPHELGLLSQLYWLDLSFNNLEGTIPYSSDGNNQVHAGLDNLTAAGHFHLNNNNLRGAIPDTLCHSDMTLIHLLLDSNRLSGRIPSGLGLCSNLIILKLNNNSLMDTVPQEIGQLSQLSELQMGGNQLTGPLPNLSTLSHLNLLELSNNSFDEAFPTWLLSLESLTDLSMQHTSVSGQVPASLFGMPSLATVRLSNNNINGTLDLSEAGDQLSLVSLEDNEIENLNPGRYRSELRLQGNPLCEGSSTLVTRVCSSAPSAPVTESSNACPGIECESDHEVDPVDCTCAIPYQVELIFGAPSFTVLSNTTLAALITAISDLLDVDQRRISVSSGSFNSQNQLFIDLMIFPISERFSSDDINRMATSLLHNFTNLPRNFGPPPKIEAASYPGGGSPSNSGLSHNAKIGIGVGTTSVVLIILAVCLFAYLQKQRADKARQLSKPFASWGGSKGESGAAPKLKGAQIFSYNELKKATNNFSETNQIGSGGYGKVYKGILPTGEQVAIKRAQKDSVQGGSEFKTEIELLSRVHHKNVVALVGFCFEQGEQMLVYEYMANGTLRENLLGRSGIKLDWHRRLMIAVGAARGITYLHELVSPPIIHRDIKSTNILLDSKKIAKVADFGLSKVGPSEDSGKQHVSTQVKGTLGYLDPEYYTSQQLTEKSDVYSFGVVLLELLTARAPIERGKYVVREVKAAIEKDGLNALRSMLDPRIRDETLSELSSFVRVALSCVEESASNRPSMGEVVKQLEEIAGNDYPESSSSTIEVEKEKRLRHPYGSDSDYLHTSADSSDRSFPNSGGHMPP